MMNNTMIFTPANTQEMDTVRSVMWTEMVMLSPLMRVNEAVERVRQVGFPKEFLYNCYVVDEDSILLGVVTIRDLILNKGGQRLEQVMQPAAATLRPEDDREEAVRVMDWADLVEIPVVDGAGRLRGVVTADTALEVQQDEATEDIERMAAISPYDEDVDYLDTGVWNICRHRMPWLLVLMLSAVFTGAIISRFESALMSVAALTAFIPMLMDTGGNCGSQSSVTVIRALSLGEISFRDVFRVLWKEVKVSVICGGLLAAANFIKMLLVDVALLGNQSITPQVALVVCLTLFFTVVCAKTVGCVLPILADKAGVDPAVMASPMITTVVDTLSLLIYFALATKILGL